MAFSRNHAATADATFSATGKTNWEASHAISGATVGGIPYCPTATTETTSASFTYSETGSNGTLTVGAVANIGTDSFARAFVSGTSGNSNLWLKSGTGTGGGCIVRTDGSNDNLVFGSDSGVKWTQNSGNGYNATIDTNITRISAGVIAIGTGANGSAAGTISAAAFISGGSAGVDFGPAAVTSITVKKGIIVAIS